MANNDAIILVCYGPKSKCELVNQRRLQRIIEEFKNDFTIIDVDAGVEFDLRRALKETESD